MLGKCSLFEDLCVTSLQFDRVAVPEVISAL